MQRQRSKLLVQQPNTVVLHGKSNFLSGNSRSTDFDHECYTRANVAYSRATDLTVSACPVNMNGTTGMSQVISALLHGVCTLYTDDQQPVGVWVEGHFSSSRRMVSESTAAFLAAMEPQPLWIGSLPPGRIPPRPIPTTPARADVAKPPHQRRKVAPRQTAPSTQ